MKYWFFDGNDVLGPFTPKELSDNNSFNGTSLVCPENFSDDGDHWQPAALFAELKSLFSKHPLEEEKNASTFEQEMDSLLKEHSPLSFDETPMDGPELEIPKKPAKPGPIEEYFNNIKEEDLGDILGIPDPNDNSDMDLAHALEKQLAQTASTRREKQTASTSTDEQTAKELEDTHHVATATEVFATKAPTCTEPMPIVQTDKELTMPMVEAPTLPLLKEKYPLQSSRPDPEEEQAAQSEGPTEITTGKALTAPTQGTQPQPQIIPNPALLRAEKVEVNSVRPRLNQTQEMKAFVHKAQKEQLKRQEGSERKIIVMLLVILSIVGGLALALQLTHRSHLETSTPAPTPAAQELLEESTPSTRTPVPAAAVQPQNNQEQQALSIVKNYRLSGERGTIENYLNRIYKAQLSKGYNAIWEAEPLYKNTYIVKYRLTKTRKEPIIYVFQTDVALGKLTGALNNISLDLVGKI